MLGAAGAVVYGSNEGGGRQNPIRLPHKDSLILLVGSGGSLNRGRGGR